MSTASPAPTAATPPLEYVIREEDQQAAAAPGGAEPEQEADKPKGLIGVDFPDIVSNSALPLIAAKVVQSMGDSLHPALRGLIVTGSITPMMLYNLIPDLKEQTGLDGQGNQDVPDAIMNGLTTVSAVFSAIESFMPGVMDTELLEASGWLNSVFQIVGMWDGFQEEGLHRSIEKQLQQINFPEKVRKLRYQDGQWVEEGEVAPHQLLSTLYRYRDEATGLDYPTEAAHYRDADGKEHALTREREGDIICIEPGMTIPADGQIVAIFGRDRQSRSHGAIDNSLLDGQVMSLETLTPGDAVLQGGRTDDNTRLYMRVTRSHETSSIMHGFQQLREFAEQSSVQHKNESAVDKYVKFLMAPLVGIELVRHGVMGLANDGKITLDEVRDGVRGALNLGITMAPCPVMAVPFLPTSVNRNLFDAHDIEVRNAANITGSSVLEKLYESDVIVVDMTGTLTEGEPKLHESDIHCFTAEGELTDDKFLQADRRTALAKTAMAQLFSSHPAAKAVKDLAYQLGLPDFDVGQKDTWVTHDEVKAHNGVSIQLRGQPVRVGNIDFMEAHDEEFRALPPETRTAIEDCLKAEAAKGHMAFISRTTGRDGKALFSVFGADDPLQPKMPETLRLLKEQYGKKIVLMTGDSKERAAAMSRRIAEKAGYGDAAELFHQVHGGCRFTSNGEETTAEEANDKAYLVSKLQEETNARGQKQTVAMVGDGNNDSRALQRADVSIAIGGRGASISEGLANMKITEFADIGRVMDVQKAAGQATRWMTRIAWGWMGLLTATNLLPKDKRIATPVISLLHELPTALIMYAGAKIAHDSVKKAFHDLPDIAARLEEPLSWEQARKLAHETLNSLKQKAGIASGDAARDEKPKAPQPGDQGIQQTATAANGPLMTPAAASPTP